MFGARAFSLGLFCLWRQARQRRAAAAAAVAANASSAAAVTAWCQGCNFFPCAPTLAVKIADLAFFINQFFKGSHLNALRSLLP